MEHFRSLPGAHADLGTEVVDVDSRPGGVHVRVRNVATGEGRSVRAQYLIAADGAHSAVRRAVGSRCTGRITSKRR